MQALAEAGADERGGLQWRGPATGGSPEGYRLVMAWDRLGSGTITAPWMVFCWVVGGVVLVTAPVVPTRRVRGILLVSVGLPAAVFSMTMIAFLSAAKLPVGPVLEALFGEHAALTAILWLLLALTAALGHLSRRLEHRPGVRLAAMVPAALMAPMIFGRLQQCSVVASDCYQCCYQCCYQ